MALRLRGKNSNKAPIMTATADDTESISCKNPKSKTASSATRDEFLHFKSGSLLQSIWKAIDLESKQLD